jgi:hypothetical protein
LIRMRDDPTRALTHDELLQQAAQYLELFGWLIIPTHDAWHRPLIPGITDLIAMRRGMNLLLEAKIGRDKLRPAQIDFANRAIRCGLEVHVVRSLDEVIEIANRL